MSTRVEEAAGQMPDQPEQAEERPAGPAGAEEPEGFDPYGDGAAAEGRVFTVTGGDWDEIAASLGEAPEERVVVVTEAPGKWLAAPCVVEHAADAEAVDMRSFNSESDDTAREDVHDNHHPEALQQDGLASKQIDAPQAVAGFSDG